MRQTFRNRFRDDSIITIVINVSPCVFITAASNHVHFGSFPHSWFLFQLFDWLYIFEDTLSDSEDTLSDSESVEGTHLLLMLRVLEGA